MSRNSRKALQGGVSVNCSWNVAKALLSMTLLLGPSIRIASSESQPLVGTEPVLDLSPKNCEQYPEVVACYQSPHLPPHHGTSLWWCYQTLCDAVADGASQCKKVGTRKHFPPADEGICEVEPG